MDKLWTFVIFAGLISAGLTQDQTDAPDPPVAVQKPSQPLNQQCWTEWFDRDDPSGTGDWELLVSLWAENPGKICTAPQDMEVKTLSGLTPAAAGDTPYIMDKQKGFACRIIDQKDKKCEDYRVRFSCPHPFCAMEVCWSDWFDRDDGSGTGDYETLINLQQEYPGKICKKPLYVEAVTVIGEIPAVSTGQSFLMYNPTDGFVCRNIGQVCLDYKVRFGCCC